jgi:hypothetical protein
METCFVSMSSSKMSNVKWQPVNDNVDLIWPHPDSPFPRGLGALTGLRGLPSDIRLG